MLPDPLHPAIVHFPIALAVLVPLLALGAVIAIRTGWMTTRIWLPVVLLQALLVGSSWLAIETGEEQEERVEDVVGDAPIHDHEEAAERFLALSIAAGLLSATGLLAGRWGAIGRVATLVAGAAVLAGGVSVGHSGGELVYVHDAGHVYAAPAQPAAAAQRE
ncbi:MAG: hypothetical protein DCC71_19580 [Proteobacteria bacterium]|nr:MAG: hypothetical protein DCC71_19580 [Pseudomonadota bacterium]